jgi:hypothetical protein
MVMITEISFWLAFIGFPFIVDGLGFRPGGNVGVPGLRCALLLPGTACMQAGAKTCPGYALTPYHFSSWTFMPFMVELVFLNHEATSAE